MYTGDTFDPDNCSKKDIQNMAEYFQSFLELKRERMIIPDDLKNYTKTIDESEEIVKELIRKMSKGKRSVFKD